MHLELLPKAVVFPALPGCLADIFHNTVKHARNVCIVRIKSTAVDVGARHDVRNGDLIKFLFLQQFDQRALDHPA